MKYRIMDKYHPDCGNWYIIQIKKFLFWKTLNKVFKDLNIAKYYIENIDLYKDSIYEKPCKTFFVRKNNQWFKKIDNYIGIFKINKPKYKKVKNSNLYKIVSDV